MTKGDFSSKVCHAAYGTLLRRTLRGRFIVMAAVTTAMFFAAGPSAQAQSAYVASLAKNGVDTPLGILNLSTGAYTFIGQTSIGLFGLNFVNNTLYGVGADGVLYSVNTSNAQLTSLQYISDQNPSTPGLLTPGGLTNSPGGTNYNLQNKDLGVSTNAFIYTVNINGNNTTVAPLDPNGGNTGIAGDGGLTYDESATNTLYASQGDVDNGIFRIDATTAVGTLLTSSSGFVGNSPVYSLFTNQRTLNNTLYAIDNGDQSANGTTGHTYTVNKTTGAATTVSAYDIVTAGRIQSAAFISGSDVTPEPASGSLALLAFGTMGGAGLVKRRFARRSKAD